MHNFLVKVENDAAEKLMSYLTAYRKMMSEKPLIPEENKEIASIFVIEPMPSQTKTSRKT
jgi:hypothetical protein